VEDAPAAVPLLNDPRVCDWLAGPPYPYTLDNSKQWIDIIKPHSDQVLEQLEGAKDEPTPIIMSSSAILASCGVCMESSWAQMALTGKNKQKREDENNNIAVGDPKIIWSMGDYLAPSHHRQGIMTDAVTTVLHEWGIPRMGIRHMWVTAYTTNEGSVKVFLKNGFKMITTYENHQEVKGKMRGLHLLEWKHDSYRG